MAANQSSLFSRPQATAACRLGGVVKVRNWWALGQRCGSAPARRRGSRPSSRSGRTSCRPSRSSRVRSRMPGKAISGRWRASSNTTCSQTSSQMAMTSWRTQNSASRARSSSGQTVAGGIDRVVQHHEPGALAEGRLQHRAVEAPVRRLQADQLGHAAGPADHRQVGVVERLEHAPPRRPARSGPGRRRPGPRWRRR